MEIELFELIGFIPYYDGRKLGITLNSQGYPRVMIDKKAHRLHRLVAIKYLPNPKNKPVVDHINGDKNNYSLSNVQWMTHSENAKKAVKNNPSMNYHASRREVISTCNDTGKVSNHRSMRACAKYLQRDIAAVVRCLNGEWNNCANHTLKFK